MAAAIRDSRLAKGLTQVQLAEALGKQQPFVATLERNQRRIDLVELMAIAAVVELDLHALIDRLRDTEDE